MKEVSTSVAFRLSYLLGVKESFLKEVYKNDFEKSNSLKYFENYKDARVLRVLSMLRQSIFLDYTKYTKRQIKSIKNLQLIPDLDMKYLKDNKIDIERAFKSLDLVKYLNFLTEMINIINYKVLVDLDLPFIDELMRYFYYPAYDFKSLKSFVEESYELNKPNGLVFYKGENIKNTLKYVLKNDKNCVVSVFSLLNKQIEVELEDYSFEFRKNRGEDLDETAKIEFEVMLENSTKSTRIVNKLEQNNEEVEIKGLEVLEETEESIASQNHILFVDCKTISMLKFLMFINSREKDEYSKIVLLVYNDLSVVWDIFVKLYKGTAQIEILKQSTNTVLKSDVDTFIAFYLGKESNICDSMKVSIISENKRILYLLEKMGLEDITFYYLKEFSDIQSKYLNDKNISVKELTFEQDINIEVLRKIMLQYGFLYGCYTIPMCEWGNKKYHNFVHDFVSIQIGLPFAYNEVETLYEDVKKFLCITRVENNFKVSINQVGLTFEIGGL